MKYAIDTDGTVLVGSGLRVTGAELREDATSLAYAAGLARRGVAAQLPALSVAVEDFFGTHVTALGLVATGCEALAGNLTRTARSAHEAELTAAGELGTQAEVRVGAMPARRPVSPGESP